jgi:hypothetical protein
MSGVKLPPVVETFEDGTIYHGMVKGFYSGFAEGHQWRDVMVWSGAEDGSSRWVEPTSHRDNGPPICWVMVQYS